MESRLFASESTKQVYAHAERAMKNATSSLSGHGPPLIDRLSDYSL